jgi:hypothetical protein
LVKAAIEHLPQASTISVDTFCEEHIAGQPARKLFQRTGFSPGSVVKIDGNRHQIFVFENVY